MTAEPRAAAGDLILPRYERQEGVHPPLNSPQYRSSTQRAPSRPLEIGRAHV